VILVHGYSRTIFYLLKSAVESGYRLNVYITEAQPHCSGVKMKQLLEELSIRAYLILDSAVGSIMSSIDYVFLGAESVVENGGIISKIGTFTIALCAKCHKKKLYVFTESLKFMKMFPLNQKDISH
jgi:translation initiation factor eIF-2B subunit alpha